MAYTKPQDRICIPALVNVNFHRDFLLVGRAGHSCVLPIGMRTRTIRHTTAYASVVNCFVARFLSNHTADFIFTFLFRKLNLSYD
jgi:hypothetical protein